MLTAMLRRSVEAQCEKAAIVQGGRRLSYQQLEREVAQCAGFLRRLGVGPRDCVAVVLPNCAEFVVAFFAVARLRAIMLPLNPSYTRQEMARFFMERPPAAVVTDARHEELVRECAGRTIVIVVERHEWAESEPIPPAEEPFSGDALYLYTSGSTDSYKRICCTQENLYFEARNFVETTGIGARDNILCTIPLFHSYGLGNCLLDAVYTGATLVLEAGSDLPFPARCHHVLELLRTENIRFYPAVPYQFEVIAAWSEEIRDAFRHVRWCVSSGDVLPQRTCQRFLARTGRAIRSLYGSTEAGSIAINADPDDRIQFGSLGLPLNNVSIDIRDGEIWVKSPVIPPSGYDNRPELTRLVFRDGFYNTGDIGRRDEHGHLILMGRKQAFINIAGYKVDTSEVEEVLAACPGVREAAVVGVEVPRIGTLVKAAVATDGSCRASDIRSFCRQRLAFFKVPRFVEFYAALPRSPVGKVLKSELAGIEGFLADMRHPEIERMVAQIPFAAAARRRALVSSLVQRQVAAVLGRPTENVPMDAGFTELGMDSFGSLELRVRLERLFDLELSETFTFDYPSIDAVTREFLNRLADIRNKIHEQHA